MMPLHVFVVSPVEHVSSISISLSGVCKRQPLSHVVSVAFALRITKIRTFF